MNPAESVLRDVILFRGRTMVEVAPPDKGLVRLSAWISNAWRATSPDEPLITVCDACLQASCWQGKFLCDDAVSAGTIDVPVAMLRMLDREHPSYWGLVA